jgi:hypothetical protein
MSQIWPEVREENVYNSCFVLATTMNVLSKYGDFIEKIPQQVRTLVHFFPKKQKLLCTLRTGKKFHCSAKIPAPPSLPPKRKKKHCREGDSIARPSRSGAP